jgi:hypothetical protein
MNYVARHRQRCPQPGSHVEIARRVGQVADLVSVTWPIRCRPQMSHP